MKVSIIDLDGTISDDRWRRHLLPDPELSVLEHDYDAYHAALHADKAVNMNLVFKAAASGRKILFVTARPEKYREATSAWLDQHLKRYGIHTSWALQMRPNEDTRPSPELKIDLVQRWMMGRPEGLTVIDFQAFDDRADVVDAFTKWGVSRATQITLDERVEGVQGSNAVNAEEEQPDLDLAREDAAALLRKMAETYAERNATYGDNFRRVAPVMRALFPEGVPSELVTTDAFHLFELILVKLSRFAASEFSHRDSIHDAAVYCAMVESCVLEQQS